MIRASVLLVFAAIALRAQESPGRADLIGLTNAIQAAIDAGDWKNAAELSASLKNTTRDSRNRAMTASGGALVDSILAWLPADTETVVVAQEPFAIAEPGPAAIPSALAMAQGYVTGILDAAESAQIAKALQGRTIRLAAVGARKFANHPPGEQNILPLGMISYQGCGVYALAEPAPKIFARPPDESVMGQPVWISKGSQNDRPNTDTYLVALPKPDLILACNDRDLLAEISSRMAAPQNPRALPADLPEWKQVDRSAALWAVRHYRYSDVDPSAAAALLGGGQDPRAIGVALEVGLPGGAVKARMISESDPWRGLASSPELHGAAHSREIAKGVWELSVDGKLEAAGMTVFALMAVLGFAVLL